MKELLTRHALDLPRVSIPHQTGVQEEATSRPSADGTDAVDVTFEIDLGRVAQNEFCGTGLARVLGPFTVRSDDFRMRHIIAVHQPINRFAVTPRFGLIGRASIAPRRRWLRHFHETFRPSEITEFTVTELLMSPGV